MNIQFTGRKAWKNRN